MELQIPNDGMIESCVLYDSLLSFMATQEHEGYHRFVVPYLRLKAQEEQEDNQPVAEFCEAALQFLVDIGIDVDNIHQPSYGSVPEPLNVGMHNDIRAAGLIFQLDSFIFHAGMAGVSFYPEILYAKLDAAVELEPQHYKDFVNAVKTLITAASEE